MGDDSNGSGLPQMSDLEVMALLLAEDLDSDQSETDIASSIGEQMLHMDIPLLPRSVRSRIRDLCSRIEPRNVTLVGGGIGHLSAWLFDLWSNSDQNDRDGTNTTPDTFRIIEPGTRFCVIIDRLIRRYEAEVWAQSISMKWHEEFAETSSSRASNITIPENAVNSILPMPIDLIIIDLPEEERVAAASAAFDLISPGGLVILLEPTVPTGDVGDFSDGDEPTAAQLKVQSFNYWIELVKSINHEHSVGFTDLTGGTLVALLKSF